jgi:hypothetical protein
VFAGSHSYLTGRQGGLQGQPAGFNAGLAVVPYGGYGMLPWRTTVPPCSFERINLAYQSWYIIFLS